MNDVWPHVLPRKNNLRFEKIKSKSGWFEIYKLNQLTYAFLEPYHYEEVISYLILGEQRAVLFDTGMGIANIKEEVEMITSLPVVVINSHSHYDHIGGNHQFDEIWGFKNKLENDRIAQGYSNKDCLKYMKEGSFINLPANVNPSAFSVQGSTINRYLNTKEIIDLGNRTLTVYSTPGETPGSISLFDNKYHIFFTGDLLYPGSMWLHLNESNWAQFSNSIDIISKMYQQIQFLCPAHNEVSINRDFIDKVKQAIVKINNKAIKGTPKDEALVFIFDSFSICLNRNFEQKKSGST